MRELESALICFADNVAVVAGDAQLTYAELEASSRHLSARVSLHALPQDALLILLVGRTIDLLIGIATALRVGRPYTIVEPGANADAEIRRLATFGPSLVLSPELEGSATEPPWLKIERRPAAINSPSRGLPMAEVPYNAKAYVLFTSGSTGSPKGVAVTQANIRHYVFGLRNKIGIPGGLRYAHVSTFKADLGNTCLFLSLLTGGTLHVLSEGCRKDPALLAGYLGASAIHFLKITPSHWGLLMRMPYAQRTFRLDYLVLGGEPLTHAFAVETINSRLAARVINHYGPTETTIGVLVHALDPADEARTTNGRPVPIGTPFGETRLLIEREDGMVCVGEATGELLIGGPSVAAGYFKDEENTSKKFVTGLPHFPDIRFYRSGDRVTRDSFGCVTFLGRLDREVKIRGYRVDLDQVETALRTLPGVRDARARPCSEGYAHHLAAILACDPDFAAATAIGPIEASVPAPLSPEERMSIRGAMLQTLPEHMIPQHYFTVPEFDLNANGKIDVLKVDALLAQTFAVHVEPALTSHSTTGDECAFDPILNDVIHTWRSRLVVRDLAVADNFFDLGGNSIDAIMMVSDLQCKGYNLSATQFLQNPTVEALVELIRSGASCAVSVQSSPPRHASDLLGPAQNWLLRRDLSDLDYWNQALAFDCSIHVNAQVLATALVKLLSMHPMLETRFDRHEHAWHAEHIPGVGSDCLSVSTLQHDGSTTVAPDIISVANRMNRSIHVRDGKVFKVHLFKSQSQPDRILFISHHLCVDAVSWRILLEDLTRIYNVAIAGAEPMIATCGRSYWDWVHHLSSHRDQLMTQSPYWERLVSQSLARADQTTDCTPCTRNRESDSDAIWFALNASDFQRVTESAGATFGCRPAEFLLGVFLHEYSQMQDCAQQWVDVESHGRLTYDDFDVSRTVGWFTSAFPVLIDCADGDIAHTIRTTAAALASVPDLGVGYVPYLESLAQRRALHLADLEDGLRPSICFNYLGDLTLATTGALTLTPSQMQIAPARGDDNSRVHDLKLTSRGIRGGLIVDLGFSRDRYLPAQMQELIYRVRERLLEFSECAHISSPSICATQGSTTGLLCFAPPQLNLNVDTSARQNRYKSVLLTGATGFLGCHLLGALLLRTDADIVCLVRKRAGVAARARLREVLLDYCDSQLADAFEARCRVIETEQRSEGFGLHPESFQELARTCDAIFHFAADTRLFANPMEVSEANIQGTQAAIHLASAGRPKHLHYMSTLAVAGVNPRAELVSLTERDLDVGQQFQNAYESSKYQCEKLVKAHASAGGTTYTYRTGNVSGHSHTGRFSRTGHDNRLVQLLRAIVELGRMPIATNERIALTPVDDVIHACLTLAVDPELAGGVYHLDNGIPLPWSDIFSTLQARGIRFEPSHAESIRLLFGSPMPGESRIVAAGRMWASRAERNVFFDCRYSQSLLSQRGFSYCEVDARWLGHLLGDLLERGFLGAKSRSDHRERTHKIAPLRG
jgi:amino acid adenylation domain-containing protein/thioester reductase-like protein